MGLIAKILQRKGRFPADVRAELERERLVLLAEGIPGTVTFGTRRQGTAAAVALTQFRLAVYGMGEPLIDVTWDSGLARELDVLVQDRGLKIRFEAERFMEGRTGPVEILLGVGDGAKLLAAIDQRRRERPPRERR